LEGQYGRVQRSAVAHLGGMWAWEPVEITTDLRALAAGGRWAVVLPYSGAPVLVRFAHWSVTSPPENVGPWGGVKLERWCSSLSEDQYIAGVRRIQDYISQGEVYQANLCRVLTADVSESDDVVALHLTLMEGNPAPYASMISVPEVDLHVVCASPELFLRREGDVLSSGPIKGTAASPSLLLDKDLSENVMIVDLVRNDLSRVAKTGTVRVPDLLRIEEHPGLVHLVSDVQCRLVSGTSWQSIVEATFPPGSVTGAPKSSALRVIDECETAEREVYCGAVGWIDADRDAAELAVAIRTFWVRDGRIRFGTGAGITWGSDPYGEWQETELKARRLCALAAQAVPASRTTSIR
jgi:para-aminobenzoate synthetase component 1